MISKIRIWFTHSIPSDLTQKAIETLSTRIFLIIFSLVTSVIVARALGPEGRGLYAIALTVSMLGIQFSNLGLHSSNTFYIARDPNLLSPLLGNSILVSLSFGGLISILAGALFYWVPDIAPMSNTILYLALIWIPVGLGYLLTQNLLLGIQEFRTFNKIEIFNKVISVLFIVILIFLNWVSAGTIFSAALVALALSFAWTIIILKRRLLRPIHISRSLFKRNLPYGIKSYLGSMVGFLMLRVDLLMINQLLGKRETGLYDIAINMSEMIYLFPLVVSTVLFPKLASLENIQEKWALSKNVGWALLIGMSAICAVAALLAYPLIEVLYGEAFVACVPAFLFLIVSKLLMSANSIFGNFIASIHVPWTAVPFNFLLLGVNILLNLAWIPKYGIIGAAFASITCFALLIPFHYYYAMKYLRSKDLSLK
jgi:O-antigen/teichoic acid export membrane protein